MFAAEVNQFTFRRCLLQIKTNH